MRTKALAVTDYATTSRGEHNRRSTLANEESCCTEPKAAEAEFESATVELEDGVVTALDIQDALGQRTRIEFFDVARNVSFKAGWFEFEPPPGVEVVGEAGL